MNLKLISLATVGTVSTVVGSLAYFLSSSDGTINPSGKTLKDKYPTLKVPEHQGSPNRGSYDNSFWIDKTKKLRENYYGKENWEALLNSIEKAASEAGYGFQRSYFNLDGSSKSFFAGDSEVATRLAKYCKNKFDKEEQTIPDFPEIMKDLCADV